MPNMFKIRATSTRGVLKTFLQHIIILRLKFSVDIYQVYAHTINDRLNDQSEKAPSPDGKIPYKHPGPNKRPVQII